MHWNFAMNVSRLTISFKLPIGLQLLMRVFVKEPMKLIQLGRSEVPSKVRCRVSRLVPFPGPWKKARKGSRAVQNDPKKVCGVVPQLETLTTDNPDIDEAADSSSPNGQNVSLGACQDLKVWHIIAMPSKQLSMHCDLTVPCCILNR